MKLTWVAALVESFYYNGRVQSDDKKMDIDDFTQLVRVACGKIMRTTFYEERKFGSNPILFFSGSIKTDYFKIEKRGRFSLIDMGEMGMLKLPDASGIIRVAPLMGLPDSKEECQEETDELDFDFIRGEPGQESTFGSADLLDDLGEAFYVPIGNTLRLFGSPQAKYAEVDYLPNDEDLDIPEGVAIDILNMVLGPVLKVAGFPVDITDNSDPNVTTVKQRLADPQGL